MHVQSNVQNYVHMYKTVLTELVPAVIMSFAEGHTQATISPLF